MRPTRYVSERDADGETERVFHEIRQTLRASGVDLLFRALAVYGKLLPVLWEETFLNAESMAFEEEADHPRLAALLDDVRETLGLPAPDDLSRALAMWPDYLDAVWTQLKPIVASERYRRASVELRATARSLAGRLPFPIALSPER